MDTCLQQLRSAICSSGALPCSRGFVDRASREPRPPRLPPLQATAHHPRTPTDVREVAPRGIPYLWWPHGRGAFGVVELHRSGGIQRTQLAAAELAAPHPFG